MRLPFNLEVVAVLKQISASAHSVASTIHEFGAVVSLTHRGVQAVRRAHRRRPSRPSGLPPRAGPLYSTLFRFELDTADEVFRAASCLSLHMLLRVLISVTSQHLVDALPLFAKSMPRHSLPPQCRAVPLRFRRSLRLDASCWRSSLRSTRANAAS